MPPSEVQDAIATRAQVVWTVLTAVAISDPVGNGNRMAEPCERAGSTIRADGGGLPC